MNSDKTDRIMTTPITNQATARAYYALFGGHTMQMTRTCEHRFAEFQAMNISIEQQTVWDLELLEIDLDALGQRTLSHRQLNTLCRLVFVSAGTKPARAWLAAKLAVIKFIFVRYDLENRERFVRELYALEREDKNQCRFACECYNWYSIDVLAELTAMIRTVYKKRLRRPCPLKVPLPERYDDLFETAA